MKKLFAVALCPVLCVLCACGSIALPEETATAAQTVEIKTNEGDPFSYVLEAYAQVDQDFLYALYEPNPPSAEAFSQGFLARPEGVFTNLKIGVAVDDDLYYAFYDIDGNGTDEMLLGTGRQSDYAGLIGVYATQDGVAVQQPLPLNWCGDCMYSYPSLRKDGTIWSVYDSWGNEDSSYSYYRFEDGQLKLKMKLILKHQTSLFRYFRNNTFNPISWKKFERLRKDYWQEAELAEIDWKPLADYLTNER